MSPIDIVPQWVRDRFEAVEGRVSDLEDTQDEHGKLLAVMKDRWALWGIFVLQAIQVISGWWKPGS